MYFIAYSSGRKLRDGFGASTDEILASQTEAFRYAGALGDERKYTAEVDGDTVALYIRPNRSGITV